MRAFLKEVGTTLKITVEEWISVGAMQRGAALAYYVLLSLGPVLLLLVGALQIFFSDQAVQAGVVEWIGRFMGSRAAETATTVLSVARPPETLSLASILTIVALLFGATAVFANVRDSLNAIWGVEEEAASKKEMVLDFFQTRLKGFLMILVSGALLLVSFALTSVADVLGRALEGSAFGSLWVDALDAGVSVAVVGLLFAAIFRTLPGRDIRWSTVWVGAYATAALFVVGKVAIAHFIARAEWTTYYGPGASVVAFMVWIYLSAQLFFFGAEFTHVWARRRGSDFGGPDPEGGTAEAAE